MLEFCLGDPRSLEIELVEDGVFGLRHDRRWAHRHARPERHAETDHPAEAVGAQLRGKPGHRCTPIVAGNHRLFYPQRIEQPDDVAYQMQQCVLIDLARLIGLTVAAHVGGHGVEAGLGQRG